MERPVLEIPLLCRSKGVSRTRRSGKYAFPERPVLENMIFRNGPFWSPSFQNGSSGSIQGARLRHEDLFLSPPPAGRACSAAGQPGSAERLVLVYGIGGSSRIYISHFSPGTSHVRLGGRSTAGPPPRGSRPGRSGSRPPEGYTSSSSCCRSKSRTAPATG